MEKESVFQHASGAMFAGKISDIVNLWNHIKSKFVFLNISNLTEEWYNFSNILEIKLPLNYKFKVFTFSKKYVNLILISHKTQFRKILKKLPMNLKLVNV